MPVRRAVAPTLTSLCALVVGLAPWSALAATGGPDVGGYTYIDSNSAGGPVYAYQFAPTLVSTLPDDGQFDITLPFSFTFYGLTYTTISVNSNGGLAFGAGEYLTFSNSCGPSTTLDLVAPFWDDLNPADIDSTGVYHGVAGTAPNRVYLVEWWNIDNYADTGDLSVEVKLFEADGAIEFHYWDTDLGDPLYTNGASATVGLAAGSFSQLQYSCNTASVTANLAVRFEPPSGPTCIDDDLDTFCDDVDCDDLDSGVYPGAPETCDGADEDCDGLIDEGFDADGDGVTSCGGDCNDNNPGVGPNATETCNGADEDCDGLIDEGFDADGDGVTSCGGDCDDSNPGVGPNATETCNGADEDCDGLVDEGFDADGDGVTSCGGDCNDSSASVGPNVSETCNGVDDDCDGLLDEGFDADGDGVTSCGGDCNDANAGVGPNATETCNGADEDCDGLVDEGFDLDGDGWTTCGGDCNDANAATNPGALDVAGDGIDQDCDGADAVLPGDDDDDDDDDDDGADDDDATGPDDDDATGSDDDDATGPDDDDATGPDDDDATGPDDDDTADDDDLVVGDDDDGPQQTTQFGCACDAGGPSAPPAALVTLLLFVLGGAARRRRV
jgi:MYXO-CTERM domain-containing protein